nr:retrovirus-related Pol polyprotein from transposon TNT 1-94 [Tanacetum cinerariifolium]
MEQYLTHIDYALWEVIMNGDASASVSGGAEAAIPSKTAKQKIARRNELKAKSTLLLAIPDEHLLNQLEIHDEVISHEDANLKLLRSLPPAWNTHTLIMQNKSDLDTLSMDDLYNNLKVYEAKIKGQSSSNLNSQNMAFVSSDNTSNTNEAVNTAHKVSAASSQGQAFVSTYADDVMFFFFANQSNSPQLDNEDLEQINTDDLEEMDLKWQVVMLTMRVKIFIKKTGRNLNFNGKETVGSNKKRLNVTTSIREVTLLESVGQQGVKGIEMETIQEGLYQWRLMLMPCQLNERDLNNKSDVFESASDSSVNESEEDNNQENDRYKACEGYHAVPPPYTGNFMPQRPDLSFAGLADSVFKSTISETITSVHKTKTSTSKTSKERKSMLNNKGKATGQREETSPSLLIIKRLMENLLHLEEVLKENRVLVTKPHNKTPYELLIGRSSNLDFMKPFGCHVTILNTLDHPGKFEGKADEGFLVGYSVNRRDPEWLFDIDSLTNSMNYKPVTARNQTNNDEGIEMNANAEKARQEKASDHEYILLSFMPSNKGDEGVSKGSGIDDQEKTDSSTQDVDTADISINTAKQIIGDLNLTTQTRRMLNFSKENAMVSYINKQRRINHKDYQNCLFACFLSQQEPKKVIQALPDPSWIEAIQEELLQFKLQKVWTLVDLPHAKRAIKTKWVFRNKKNERGIVVRNKARLMAQGYTQEKVIDYEEVFAPVARIEVIRIFLASASFMGFIMYQMDVKSAFLYSTIEEEVYVCQPHGFEDPHFPNKVYKVDKALYGLYQAPRA